MQHRTGTPRRCLPAPPAPQPTTSPDDNSIAKPPRRGPPNPWSPGRATSRPFFLLSVCDRTAPAYSQNNHNAQRASRRRGRLVWIAAAPARAAAPRPPRRPGVARRPVAAAAAPAPARARLAHTTFTHTKSQTCFCTHESTHRRHSTLFTQYHMPRCHEWHPGGWRCRCRCRPSRATTDGPPLLRPRSRSRAA